MVMIYRRLRNDTTSSYGNVSVCTFDITASVSLTYLPSATKLRRLCFYKRVSVHRGGVPDQVHPPGPGAPPWDQLPPPPPDQVHPPREQVHPLDQVHPPRTRYTPPGPGTPPSPQTRYPPRTRYTPHPPDTATAAGGMHPTGMHSCLYFN